MISRSTTLALVALGLTIVLSGCSRDDATPSTATEDTMTQTDRNPFELIDAEAPVAERRPLEIEQHGIKRIDNYAWLRDENWQEVLRDPSELDTDIREYLNAENTYYAAATDDLAELRETLFQEMRSRIKEDDSSVPAAD
ncbi:MAG: S9 family peptidase, partial [Pseudomonadota bacterium]